MLAIVSSGFQEAKPFHTFFSRPCRSYPSLPAMSWLRYAAGELNPIRAAWRSSAAVVPAIRDPIAQNELDLFFGDRIRQRDPIDFAGWSGCFHRGGGQWTPGPFASFGNRPRHYGVQYLTHTLCAHLKACSRIKAINTHKSGSSIGQVNDSGVSIN